MNNDDILSHMTSLGWRVETLTGNDNLKYNVIRGYSITSGSLTGKRCDIAFEIVSTIPYVFPNKFHTRPAMLPMDWDKFRTRVSDIGPEWQYWSRRLDKQPTPKEIVTHIATIFKSV